MKKQISAHLFMGFKTSRAIPVRRDSLLRDYLIQGTLDPYVRGIDYLPTVILDGQVTDVEAVIVDRMDGCFVVDFIDMRPVCDPYGRAIALAVSQRECDGLIEVASKDIRMEPRFSSARAVWNCRLERVHPRDHSETLQVLRSEGQMTLGRLDRLICARGEGYAVFCAMACDGSIEIDLHEGLSADTVVRIGSSHPIARARAYGA